MSTTPSKQTQQNKPKRKSKLRWFGQFVSLPLSVLLVGLAFSRLHARQIEAHGVELKNAIGSLSAAASLYAHEHGGRLPPASNWEQELQPNTGPIPLQLPAMPGGKGLRIALNRALAGRRLDTIAQPSRAILFYESTGTTPNACDDLTSLVPPGDTSPLLLGFADGHIEEIVPASRREEVLARSRNASQAVTPPTAPTRSPAKSSPQKH